MNYERIYKGGPFDGGVDPVSGNAYYPNLCVRQTWESNKANFAVYRFDRSETSVSRTVRIYEFMETIPSDDALMFIRKNSQTLGPD